MEEQSLDIKHILASSVKKGTNILIDGDPCRVVDVQISKQGKHGHSKVRISAMGIIDDKKRVTVQPGHDNLQVPIVNKKNAQILSISGNMANIMDSDTYETFDLEIPEELKAEVAEGVQVMYWEIMGKKMMKQVK
jgi:translation initiation factor 5A